jgi:hemolysin activation/secretion protein
MKPDCQSTIRATRKSMHLFTLLLTLAILKIITPVTAFAQAAIVPPDADTSRLRPAPLPLPSVPNFDLRIEAPEKSSVPKAVDELSFEIKEIIVEGAKQYDSSEIKRFFDSLLGKSTTLSSVRDAADKLEERYRKDGFFLVRVFIPPQQVKDGIFRIRVVEGFIEGVYAEGGTEPARQLIENMLAHLINKQPIDLPSLERALLVLNDMPGVRGSGVLRQGGQLGASELVVSLAELPKNSYVIGINNTASKTMGEISSLVSMTINNPFASHPGQLSLGFNTSGNTERLKAFNARYAAAVGTQGIVMSLGGLIANAKPGASLKPLDIESNSASLSPRLRYALTRSRGLSSFVDGGLTFNYSRTTLLGNELTQDRTTVFDIGLSLLDSDRWDGSTEFGVNMSQGLVALGANREKYTEPVGGGL